MKKYTQDDIFTAWTQSNSISDYLHTASWLYGCDDRGRNHNLKEATKRLKETADTLGFKLVEKEE